MKTQLETYLDGSCDLHCRECGIDIAGNGGNNASSRECATNAKRHYKETGHRDFVGTVFFGLQVVPEAFQ